jgi:hypothetical protein
MQTYIHGNLEQKLLNEAPHGHIPIEWIRFIDDYHTLRTCIPQLNLTTHAYTNQSTSLTQLFTLIPTTNSNQIYT